MSDTVQHKVYAYRNEGPQAVGTLPAQMLAEGGAAQTLLVTSAFRDPDEDALTYSATSSDETVATVTVSGAAVTVQPVAVGMVDDHGHGNGRGRVGDAGHTELRGNRGRRAAPEPGRRRRWEVCRPRCWRWGRYRWCRSRARSGTRTGMR